MYHFYGTHSRWPYIILPENLSPCLVRDLMYCSHRSWCEMSGSLTNPNRAVKSHQVCLTHSMWIRVHLAPSWGSRCKSWLDPLSQAVIPKKFLWFLCFSWSPGSCFCSPSFFNATAAISLYDCLNRGHHLIRDMKISPICACNKCNWESIIQISVITGSELLKGWMAAECYIWTLYLCLLIVHGAFYRLCKCQWGSHAPHNTRTTLCRPFHFSGFGLNWPDMTGISLILQWRLHMISRQLANKRLTHRLSWG